MTCTYTLTTPPPSLNNMYFNRSTGGRSKRRDYKLWRRATSWELVVQRRTLGINASITAKVAVEILLPRAVRGDVDNRGKGALDCLQEAGIIKNDSQCDPVTIRRADVAVTTIHITARGTA